MYKYMYGTMYKYMYGTMYKYMYGTMYKYMYGTMYKYMYGTMYRYMYGTMYKYMYGTMYKYMYGTMYKYMYGTMYRYMYGTMYKYMYGTMYKYMYGTMYKYMYGTMYRYMYGTMYKYMYGTMYKYMYGTMYKYMYGTMYKYMYGTMYRYMYGTMYKYMYGTMYKYMYGTMYRYMYGTMYKYMYGTMYRYMYGTMYKYMYGTMYRYMYGTMYKYMYGTMYKYMYGTMYKYMYGTMYRYMYGTMYKYMYGTMYKYMYGTMYRYMYGTMYKYMYGTMYRYMYGTMYKYMYGTMYRYMYGTMYKYMYGTMYKYMYDSFEDLKGHKMRIVTPSEGFPYIDYQRVRETPGSPVVLKDSLDARLIKAFAAKLNFTFEIHEEAHRTWGVEMTVGNFSGMIGLLQREQKDFCTATGPTANRLRVVEYLRGYPSDPSTITSLKPSLLPKYLALIRPFEGKLWVAVLVSVVSWGATLWLLQRAWQKVAGGRPVGLITSLLYGYGALLQNLPSDPSVTDTGRMLVGWWLVFCLIITTGFSSSLMAHLTVKERSRPLETFEDLVNQPHWKWGTDHWMLTEAAVDYYTKHPNPVTRHIFRKMELMQVDEALKKVLAGGFSYITYKNYVTVIIETRYSDARGDTPLYISKKSFPILAAFGWGIRKGAPFYQRFTQLMTRLEAAGIITYWTEDLMARRAREGRKAAMINATTILGNAIQDEGEEVVLSLNHLQGAFYMLLVGSCVAFLTLLGENLAHCCSSPQ
nr:ionotropic receptor 21a-like [Procambarus clarkii]